MDATVSVNEEILYIAAATSSYVVNISNISNPTVIQNIENVVYGLAITSSINGEYLFIQDYNVGVKIFDISYNATNPKFITYVQAKNNYEVVLSPNEQYLISIDYNNDFKLVDISNINFPITLNKGLSNIESLAISQDGKTLYTPNGETGLLLVELTNS